MGEPRADLAWRINRLQSAMGLELSQFEELESMGYDDYGDQQESEEEWNLNFLNGTNSEEPYTGEWSPLDKILLKEEIEAEKENDDW
jgi:hypothetical protein